MTHLDESNGSRLLVEALSADHEVVLPHDTTSVSADTASSGSLSVSSWVAEPDACVSHVGRCEVGGLGSVNVNVNVKEMDTSQRPCYFEI